MGPKRTGIVLTEHDVQVKAGGFRVAVSRDQVASVSQCSPPWWALAGVHTDLRGRWIVDGGPGRLVRLDFHRPRRAGWRACQSRYGASTWGWQTTPAL